MATNIFQRKRANGTLLVLCSSLLISPPTWAKETVESFLDLPLEDLLSMQVTSVSKKKQSISEAPAAVYVITQEDIQRSGVTSIPEALRMAPGIQVARIDANKWAISSRGFNTQFANKLLVLIDGRSVYTPSYSGVYWEIQDTLLEDIDRIEVIRGPGATLWGANAVNGVINIITKQASDTHGGVVVAGAGNEEKAFAGLRYGGALNASTHGRFYLKFNDRDSSYATVLQDEAGDDWLSKRAGFRLDGELSEADSWTLQGDVYQTDQNQIMEYLWKDPYDPANSIYAPLYDGNYTPDAFESSGWNLLGRWEHSFSEDSASSLQVYYDHTDRDEDVIRQINDTLDIDFHHRFKPMERHDVVWGLGYRRVSDEFGNTFAASLLPAEGVNELYSAFVQDEIELVPDRLRLTLGSKFEMNDYTGFEVQPSIRLLWRASETSSYWASVSRAVKTPARLEDGSRIVAQVVPAVPGVIPFPVVFTTTGNNEFESETQIAYELGYRVQPRENISFDLALFYNNYDNLLSFERDLTSTLASTVTDASFDNKMALHSYGLELASDWRPKEWWRLQANYAFIRLSGEVDNDSQDLISVPTIEGSTPRHQVSIRSHMDLVHNWSLDLWANWTDKLKRSSLSDEVETPAFTSLNARLAWQPAKNLELSLTGRNLLDSRHQEFVAENLITETQVERSIFAQVRWKF